MEKSKKKRLVSRWLGEALRETAVLVVIFVPLDWFLGRQDKKISAMMVAMTSAIVLFTGGVNIGFDGERGGEYEGDVDVE